MNWQLFRDIIGSLAVGWLANQVPTSLGILLVAAWLVFLAYEVATSKWFMATAWKDRRIPRMVVYLIAAVVGAATAVGLVRLSEWKHEQPVEALQPTAGHAEPEIILLSPINVHRYYWVPEKILAVYQGPAPPKDLGAPIFRIKNLSNDLITRVTITWTISEPIPITKVFLESEHFKHYGASITSDPLAPFQFTNEKGDGSGSPASDQEITDIPFLRPSPSLDDSMDVSLPTPIANSYALRLAATMPRPDPSNHPSTGGGIKKTIGPLMHAVVNYSQAGKNYLRNFRVTSEVLTLSETVNAGDFGGYVEPAYWSPDNLRTIVTFKVAPSDTTL
jgi:hypothetical protein